MDPTLSEDNVVGIPPREMYCRANLLIGLVHLLVAIALHILGNLAWVVSSIYWMDSSMDRFQAEAYMWVMIYPLIPLGLPFGGPPVLVYALLVVLLRRGFRNRIPSYVCVLVSFVLTLLIMLPLTFGLAPLFMWLFVGRAH
jgi:hypothetical protein